MATFSLGLQGRPPFLEKDLEMPEICDVASGLNAGVGSNHFAS